MNKSFSDFFGFSEGPFKRTPDVDFFFTSKRHHEALYTLNYLVQSEEAFAVVVGDPGTGKSITVRRFMEDLPDSVVYAYILFPNLLPEELFKAVLEDFGVSLDGNVSKNALFSRFKDFLIKMNENGKQVLIIVDEAQNLPIPTLEELRILSNLETDKEKLLKIILVGQPELDEKLNSNQLRQLKQRISLTVRLINLTIDESVDYINYRIQKAGRYNMAINKSLTKIVWKYTKGNPRLINTVMERAIIAAYMDGVYTIKKTHIESAINSLNILADDEPIDTPLILKLAAVAMLVMLITVTGFATIKFIVAKDTKEPQAVVLNVDSNNNIVANPITNSQTGQRGSVSSSNLSTTSSNNLSRISPTGELSLNNAPTTQVGTPGEQSSNTEITQPNMSNSATQIPTRPTESTVSIDSTPAPQPITPTQQVLPGNTFYVGQKVTVATGILNVRSQPSIESVRLGVLSKDTMITVEEEYLDWVKITVNGSVGWVYKMYLNK